eukprot:s2715_g8.t1
MGMGSGVALGQDQVERLQREIQAFLPSQQQMQQEARQAQQESDKARSLAQRRREAVSKLEEEAQQVERSAEEEQATMSARLEQMRTDLNETVASTTELALLPGLVGSHLESQTTKRGAMNKEQWEFLLGDWQDCRESGKRYAVSWASSNSDCLTVKTITKGRRGFMVRASYDQKHDCLHWPSSRNGGFTLSLADCGDTVRWRYKSTQEPANEWMRVQEVEERAQLQRKRPLEEEPGDTDTLCEVASSLDLESELDKSHVFFQIVTCGKDRYMSHHMQKQAIVFDVRNFKDPAAGNLKHHDGRHDEIIDRIRRHSAFPNLVVSLRTRIAQELQRSGSTSIKVVFYCKSGRHRSVAFGTMFKYILLYEGFRNAKLEHEGNYDGFVCCSCDRCTSTTALRLKACEDALRDWKRMRRSPSV